MVGRYEAAIAGLTSWLNFALRVGESGIHSQTRRTQTNDLWIATSALHIDASLVSCGGEPELVNDRPDSAPSKRVIEHVNALSDSRPYAKSTDGPTIVAQIGLETLRRGCPHLHHWLADLESRSPARNA